MKLLLGLMYILLGAFRFYAIPVDSDLMSPEQERVNSTEQDTTKKMIYIPEKVTLNSFKVLTVADTAFKTEDIGRLLNKDYQELFSYIDRRKLKAGKVMAFYYSSQLPFVFDAAVEVNSLPVKLTGRIKGKKIKGGDAIVVHYQGSYDQVGAAYTAITKWMKENNKKALEQPFEVYLNDPLTVKDPQQLRTDVYQRIQ
jgi:effector-binding domain-containing protein